jgi:hypothetical protein
MIGHVKLKKIGHGTECIVFDVGYNIVYKMPDLEYTDMNKIECMFVAQTKAAELGLAPDTIAIDDEGYYSEKVLVLGEMANTFKKQIRAYRIKELLKRRMQKVLGVWWTDCHPGNVGIKGFHAVCIDFGWGLAEDLLVG